MELTKNKGILLVAAIYMSFLLANVNFLLFGHYHILENGRVVYHAHPFTDTDGENTPIKSHKHSKSEILFYAGIINPVFLISVFILSSLFLFGKKLKTISHYSKHIKQGFSYNFRLRAPPAFNI